MQYPKYRKKSRSWCSCGWLSQGNQKRDRSHAKSGAVVDTMLSAPSHTDLNPRLSHNGQGTNCTAQPTVDGMLLLSVKKAKRLFDDQSKRRNYNVNIVSEISSAEKYAQNFGSFEALNCVISTLLTLECDEERRKVKGEASRMKIIFSENYLRLYRSQFLRDYTRPSH